MNIHSNKDLIWKALTQKKRYPNYFFKAALDLNKTLRAYISSYVNVMLTLTLFTYVHFLHAYVFTSLHMFTCLRAYIC